MIKEEIQKDLKGALKGKKAVELSVLRMILAALERKETEKRTNLWKKNPELSVEELKKESKLSDEDIIGVISSEIRKRKEALLEFEKGGRRDLAEKEKKEIDILKKYLPEQLSKEEIKKMAREIIEKIGAKEPRDIGKVMAELMAKIKGRAEGGAVNKIVKDLLISND